MELERRGVTTLTICSDAFLALGKIQAKAMGIEPNFIAIPHPLGGISADDVLQRHAETAWQQVESWVERAVAIDASA